MEGTRFFEGCSPRAWSRLRRSTHPPQGLGLPPQIDGAIQKNIAVVWKAHAGFKLLRQSLPRVLQVSQRDGFSPSEGKDAVFGDSANPCIFWEEHFLIKEIRAHTLFGLHNIITGLHASYAGRPAHGGNGKPRSSQQFR